MSYIPFSDIPRHTSVRISNCRHASVAQSFCPEGTELVEVSDSHGYSTGEFAVEVTVKILYTARTVNFGWVAYLQTDESFCPNDWTLGEPYPIYEDDEWHVEILTS